ncbi:hypothetical protein D9M71_624120 [compost metagenome]
MGLSDREWFRNSRREKAEPSLTPLSKRDGPEITSREREPWIKKMPVPPEHAVWAARYELALRRRTRKTFAAGVIVGSLVAAAAFWLINILQS